ncbi:MAG: ABC transporter permease subunit [Chthonomonas sp.]|nr:ABC transporter permease subunit [Chthonomonas sp.]
MPLINPVGRKSWRARIALATIYLILTVGAVTTLYPFLLMVSTGLKGMTDQSTSNLVPTYLTENSQAAIATPAPESLAGKYLDDKYFANVNLRASMAGGPTEFVPEYEAWLRRLPVTQWHAGFRIAPTQVTSRLAERYRAWLRERFGDIDRLNRAYLEENSAFQGITPPQERLDVPGWRPLASAKWRDWLEFKATLPAEFRVPLRLEFQWQEFWRGRTAAQWSEVPPTVRGAATDYSGLVFPRKGSSPEKAAFLAKQWPANLPDLEAKFVADTPGAKGMPVGAYDRHVIARDASQIRGEFAGRNYRYVIDYVLLHGRAVLNTVIFCSLAILFQLTVNPLAAYALSRFPIKSSGKILLFLLATMAFPAEIALIPSFLLLRDLGLLNTFWALVLPGAASGYMIFLLKGFFDSLPQELFEAGQLDGAPERTMMWRIALPLSRPVLGYVALLAFMGAYSAFIFAFLVCQDQSKWTLMVWLYQLQLSAPRATVMAALTLAALPTLIVFLAAQRVIMRGIVLPGER